MAASQKVFVRHLTNSNLLASKLDFPLLNTAQYTVPPAPRIIRGSPLIFSGPPFSREWVFWPGLPCLRSQTSLVFRSLFYILTQWFTLVITFFNLPFFDPFDVSFIIVGCYKRTIACALFFKLFFNNFSSLFKLQIPEALINLCTYGIVWNLSNWTHIAKPTMQWAEQTALIKVFSRRIIIWLSYQNTP